MSKLEEIKALVPETHKCKNCTNVFCALVDAAALMQSSLGQPMPFEIYSIFFKCKFEIATTKFNFRKDDNQFIGDNQFIDVPAVLVDCDLFTENVS